MTDCSGQSCDHLCLIEDLGPDFEGWSGELPGGMRVSIVAPRAAEDLIIREAAIDALAEIGVPCIEERLSPA